MRKLGHTPAHAALIVRLLLAAVCALPVASRPQDSAESDKDAAAVKYFGNLALSEERDFESCVVAKAGTYINGKAPNDDVADLAVAGCLRHLLNRSEALFSMYSVMRVASKGQEPSPVTNLAHQALADEDTRKLMQEGRARILRVIGEYRLSAAKAKAPLGKRGYQ